MDKTEVRKSLKQDRLSMAPDDRAGKSQEIVGRLNNAINGSNIKYLHVFEPLDQLGEVDISDFYERIKAEHPNVRVYTSKKIAEKWRITSLGGESLDNLPQFDAIIVPMLGFDPSLHRIGYGGGYYDRLLATQPTAQKIGVCFEVGKLAQLPTEIHDIPLDQIITETQVYTTS